MSPDPAVTEATTDADRGDRPGRPGKAEPGGPPPVRAARPSAKGATTPEQIARESRAGAADTAAGAATPASGAAADTANDTANDTATDTPGERPAGRPAARGGRPSSRAGLVTAEEVLSRRQRRHVERLRARKVRRVVRHVDAWSVLKVSLLFYLCSYVIGLVSGVILWNVADRAGYIEKVESFIEDLFAYETFEFLPGTLFTAAALGGAILAIVATGLTALGAVLFNLISDLMGGIRMTMVELPGARPALRPRKAARLAARTAAAVEKETAAEPAPRERRPRREPAPDAVEA